MALSARPRLLIALLLLAAGCARAPRSAYEPVNQHSRDPLQARLLDALDRLTGQR